MVDAIGDGVGDGRGLHRRLAGGVEAEVGRQLGEPAGRQRGERLPKRWAETRRVGADDLVSGPDHPQVVVASPHDRGSPQLIDGVVNRRWGSAQEAADRHLGHRLRQDRDRVDHVQREPVQSIDRAQDRRTRGRPCRELCDVHRHRIDEIGSGAQQHGELGVGPLPQVVGQAPRRCRSVPAHPHYVTRLSP